MSTLDLSQICTPSACPGWQTLAIDGALLSWMRQHFALGNITHPPLQSRVWNANYQQSQILIERTAQWRPQTTEQRPAILLARQDLQPLHLGIGDRLMIAGPQATSQDHRSVLQVGAHTLFMMSRSDGECELLGDEVYQELLKFGPLVADRLNLARLRSTGLSKLKVADEATQNYVVTVSVMYAWWDTWQITPAGPWDLNGQTMPGPVIVSKTTPRIVQSN